mgnify:CR=1 FL=1
MKIKELRELNIDELKLWFNHKIMHNPYKDDPNIKCYINNIRKKYVYTRMYFKECW